MCEECSQKNAVKRMQRDQGSWAIIAALRTRVPKASALLHQAARSFAVASPHLRVGRSRISLSVPTLKVLPPFLLCRYCRYRFSHSHLVPASQSSWLAGRGRALKPLQVCRGPTPMSMFRRSSTMKRRATTLKGDQRTHAEVVAMHTCVNSRGRSTPASLESFLGSRRHRESRGRAALTSFPTGLPSFRALVGHRHDAQQQEVRGGCRTAMMKMTDEVWSKLSCSVSKAS